MSLPENQKTREEVVKEVRALGWWYQHFELPSGVWTGTGEEPSYRPETRWKLIEPYVPEDLSQTFRRSAIDLTDWLTYALLPGGNFH